MRTSWLAVLASAVVAAAGVVRVEAASDADAALFDALRVAAGEAGMPEADYVANLMDRVHVEYERALDWLPSDVDADHDSFVGHSQWCQSCQVARDVAAACDATDGRCAWLLAHPDVQCSQLCFSDSEEALLLEIVAMRDRLFLQMVTPQGMTGGIDVDVDAQDSEDNKWGNKEKCKACKWIVSYLIDKCGGEAGKAALDKAIAVACAHTGPLMPVCTWVVSHYANKLIDSFIKHQGDPDKVCAHELHFCKDEPEPEPEQEDVPELTDEELEELGQMLLQLHEEQQDDESEVEENLQHHHRKCKACKWVVKYLVKKVGVKAAKAALHKVIAGACMHTGPLMPVCYEVVKHYADKLIDAFIKHQGDPDKVCQEIHLCKKPDPPVVPELTDDELAELGQLLLQLHEEQQDDESEVEENLQHHHHRKCKACKWVVKYLVKKVGVKAAKAALHKVIAGACMHTGPLMPVCYEVVKHYADKLIDAFIKHQGDPDKVCQEIHLCKKPDPAVPVDDEDVTDEQVAQVLASLSADDLADLGNLLLDMRNDDQSTDDPEELLRHHERRCKACRFVVKWLVDKVGVKAAKAVLHKVIMGACTHTGPLMPVCYEVIKHFVDALIDYFVESYGDPNTVCMGIRLCDRPHYDDLVPAIISTADELTVVKTTDAADVEVERRRRRRSRRDRQAKDDDSDADDSDGESDDDSDDSDDDGLVASRSVRRARKLSRKAKKGVVRKAKRDHPRRRD